MQARAIRDVFLEEMALGLSLESWTPRSRGARVGGAQR